MLLQLIKDYKKANGRVVPKGKQIKVTNEKGRELVKNGIAKEADKDQTHILLDKAQKS